MVLWLGGDARHLQCVNDIGVNVLFLHTGLCPLPLPPYPHRVVSPESATVNC